MIGILPEIMRMAGFPLIRMEKGDGSTQYFFRHPKRNTEISFSLTDTSEGNSLFLMMRLSKAFKEVVAILGKAGVFESTNSH